jgi:hypothetical protein
VRAQTAALIEHIRSHDDSDRDRIAIRLADLPAEDLVWGRKALPVT